MWESHCLKICQRVSNHRPVRGESRMSSNRIIRSASTFLPEGESVNSPGWSSRQRTKPWESGTITIQSRRDDRNPTSNPTRIGDEVLFQNGDEPRLEIPPAAKLRQIRFERPYRAGCVFSASSQGCIRWRELHPGLSSVLPPGGFTLISLATCDWHTPTPSLSLRLRWFA